MTNGNNDVTALTAAISRVNGFAEVKAEWVKENMENVRLIDVREPHELAGPLGAIEDVENVPLLQLLSGAADLKEDAALVLICRSGRRSAMAAEMLENAGFKGVASVEGGMLAWNVDVFGKHDVHADERVANTHNLHDAIFRTNGFPEVAPEWVQSNLGRFKLIDVRQPMELSSGRVLQAENIPLNQFMQVAAGWERAQPVVVLCASGGRSARAAMALENAGFKNVASMEGGMFGWRGAGLPAV